MIVFKNPIFTIYLLLALSLLNLPFEATAAAKFDIDAGVNAFFSPIFYVAKILATFIVPIFLIWYTRHSSNLIKILATIASLILILFIWLLA